MKMLCPQCGSALPPEAVNIATDLAQCPECGQVNRASACVVEDEISKDVLRQPPPGTWRAKRRGESSSPLSCAPRRLDLGFLHRILDRA